MRRGGSQQIRRPIVSWFNGCLTIKTTTPNDPTLPNDDGKFGFCYFLDSKLNAILNIYTFERLRDSLPGLYKC